jgi:hypothetical protein
MPRVKNKIFLENFKKKSLQKSELYVPFKKGSQRQALLQEEQQQALPAPRVKPARKLSC